MEPADRLSWNKCISEDTLAPFRIGASGSVACASSSQPFHSSRGHVLRGAIPRTSCEMLTISCRVPTDGSSNFFLAPGPSFVDTSTSSHRTCERRSYMVNWPLQEMCAHATPQQPNHKVHTNNSRTLTTSGGTDGQASKCTAQLLQCVTHKFEPRQQAEPSQTQACC